MTLSLTWSRSHSIKKTFEYIQVVTEENDDQKMRLHERKGIMRTTEVSRNFVITRMTEDNIKEKYTDKDIIQQRDRRTDNQRYQTYRQTDTNRHIKTSELYDCAMTLWNDGMDVIVFCRSHQRGKKLIIVI